MLRWEKVAEGRMRAAWRDVWRRVGNVVRWFKRVRRDANEPATPTRNRRLVRVGLAALDPPYFVLIGRAPGCGQRSFSGKRLFGDLADNDARSFDLLFRNVEVRHCADLLFIERAD